LAGGIACASGSRVTQKYVCSSYIPISINSSASEQLTFGDDTWGSEGYTAIVLVGDDSVGAALFVAEAGISVSAAAFSSALVALQVSFVDGAMVRWSSSLSHHTSSGQQTLSPLLLEPSMPGKSLMHVEPGQDRKKDDEYDGEESCPTSGRTDLDGHTNPRPTSCSKNSRPRNAPACHTWNVLRGTLLNRKHQGGGHWACVEQLSRLLQCFAVENQHRNVPSPASMGAGVAGLAGAGGAESHVSA